MIFSYQDTWPEIHETAFIAPSADIVGRVKIGAESSVWFQCVVRGDVHSITIGDRTNVQDLTMLHVTHDRYKLTIGDEVTIGHRALVHGCTIGSQCLIGMGSIIMDGAEIGEQSVVGAGSLVTEGKKFPPRSLIIGSPAKVVRQLSDEEVSRLKYSADHYVRVSQNYRLHVPSPERSGVSNRDLEDLNQDIDFDPEGELS